MGVPLLELQEHARTLGIHSLPREAEAGASEYRDWRSRQDQSIKNLLSGMESGAFSPRLRTNSEASMNPAILLVDFVSADREGLQSFLQSQQCDVDTAANGESAVRCCLEIQPDLVLLYDSLPDIGSFDLCRRLKNNPLNQLTPVVLVKPSPDQWDIYRGREAGALDIWAMPPSLRDLLGRIQTLLRLKKYMDEQARSAVFS